MIHQLVVVTAAALLAQSGPIHRAPPISRMAFPVNPPTTGAAIYHVGASLVCSDCHVMHASEQHAMDGTATRDMWPLPYADAPNQTLLRKATTNELCLACHDGKTFAPDVLGTDTNGPAERAAGMFEARGVANPRGHSLSSVDMPVSGLCDRCHFGGSMATATVQCIDCHAPHGNQGYRNLQWASAPGSEPPLLAYTRPGATGLARYQAANVRYPGPSGGAGWFEITNMCVDCHHAFMDYASGYYTRPGGSTGPFVRHPGTNNEGGISRPIDAPGANTTPANWVSGTVGFDVPRLPFMVTGATDFAAAGAVAANNEVFCLTCHKAHGSDRQFALRWDYGTVSSATQSSGCAQCHAQARGE